MAGWTPLGGSGGRHRCWNGIAPLGASEKESDRLGGRGKIFRAVAGPHGHREVHSRANDDDGRLLPEVPRRRL